MSHKAVKLCKKVLHVYITPLTYKRSSMSGGFISFSEFDYKKQPSCPNSKGTKDTNTDLQWASSSCSLTFSQINFLDIVVQSIFSNFLQHRDLAHTIMLMSKSKRGRILIFFSSWKPDILSIPYTDAHTYNNIFVRML